MNPKYGLTEYEVKYIPLIPVSPAKINYKKEVAIFTLTLLTIVAVCVFIKFA